MSLALFILSLDRPDNSGGRRFRYASRILNPSHPDADSDFRSESPKLRWLISGFWCDKFKHSLEIFSAIRFLGRSRMLQRNTRRSAIFRILNDHPQKARGIAFGFCAEL
ncbi:MAG TPA: hypothetical protein VK597_13290 [Inquilinus sp.]|nr:hypothetical protein [Inquilinus sp.]